MSCVGYGSLTDDADKDTPMPLWYFDTEFLWRPPALDLISVGMVAEDGRTWYAINVEAPWSDIVADPWMADNVVARLAPDDGHPWQPLGASLPFDPSHPACMHPHDIAAHLTSLLDEATDDDPLRLVADHASHDHVVLTGTYGSFLAMPDGFPWFPVDLAPYYRCRPEVAVPAPARPHNALSDAHATRAYAHALGLDTIVGLSC